MADYFQNYLDGTPWDRAVSRTAVSTRQGLALQLDGGVLQLLAPNPPSVLVSAPAEQVTVTVKGLAAKGGAALVDFGTSAWMVDFSHVGSRTEAKTPAYVLKRFLGLGGFASLKTGKALRANFVQVMSSHGAKVDN